jgi:hypothetical protein
VGRTTDPDPVTGECPSHYNLKDVNGTDICWGGLSVNADPSYPATYVDGRLNVVTKDVGIDVDDRAPDGDHTGETLYSTFKRDVLEAGDRNQIAFLFVANNLVGTSDPRFGVGIDAHVDDPDWTSEHPPKASLRFLIYNRNGTYGEVMRVNSDYNVGIGSADPTERLYVNGNIYATGNVTWGSSRDLKEGIEDLTEGDAIDALNGLSPKKYFYKADREDGHIGFIAEEVPDILATKDRKSLDPMDIVAVLTKVVQAQQAQIESLRTQIDQIRAQE